MTFLITFLEGIQTFISPCMLPMLPIYISFFSGNTEIHREDEKKIDSRAFINAVAFVLGFSTVFVLLGAFAASLGTFLTRYRQAVAVISGIIMILFGLNYMEVLNIRFINKMAVINYKPKRDGRFLSSLIFGVIFSVGWTPCVSVFLGSALMSAAHSETVLKGALLLFTFSLGLGIPFIITAVLLNKLTKAFNFVKRNYKIINKISGAFLIITGLLMATGILDKILAKISTTLNILK